MNQMPAQPRQFCASFAERTLRAHGNLPASDFAGSGDREAHMGGMASKGSVGRRRGLEKSPRKVRQREESRGANRQGDDERARQSEHIEHTENNVLTNAKDL